MASISEKVCIDKLIGTVDEYNNTYHRTIKMKPIDAKSSTYIEIKVKIVNFKLMIMLEDQNRKKFLKKAIF